MYLPHDQSLEHSLVSSHRPTVGRMPRGPLRRLHQMRETRRTLQAQSVTAMSGNRRYPPSGSDEYMSRRAGRAVAIAAFVATAVAAAALESASAQTPAEPNDTPAAQTTGAGAGNAGEKVSLPPIIVTAEKFRQNLQDVPVAVTAVTAGNLSQQQLTSSTDLSYSVPNLVLYPNTTTTTSSAVYLRGIGQDDSTPTAEQGVATYVDDVLIPHAQGGVLDLGNIARVEVLRGPQGTLYGRNSIGGAINYVTLKPSLTGSESTLDFTTGSFHRADFVAGFTTPLVGNVLGIRVDAASTNRDGYIYQESNGHDVERIARQATRVALRLQPLQAVTWDFAVDGTRDRSGMQAPVPIGPVSGGTLPQGYGPLYGSFWVTGSDATDENRFDSWGAASTIAWQLPWGTLKSVSSYRGLNTTFYAPLGGRPGAADQTLFRKLKERDYTQEFQVASTQDAKLTYVAGLFYYNDELHDTDAFLILDDYVQSTKSYAVYGQVTYNFTKALGITVGGRFTRDEKSMTANDLGLGGAFSVHDLPLNSDNFSPKFSIQYHLSDAVLTYASISRGYLAGAFQSFPQARTDLTQEQLRPATETAYEIGLKSEFLQRRVKLNLALFDSAYRNKQVSAFNPATLGFVAGTVDETIKGAELEFDARLTQELTLNGFATWLDAVVTSSAYPTNPLVPPVGARAAFVPEYMTKIGFNWTKPLAGSAGGLFASAYASWVSRTYFDVLDTPYISQGAHELVEARFGWRAANDRLEVALGGKNLTNVQWFNNSSTTAGGTIFPQPPRTWSLEFRYSE